MKPLLQADVFTHFMAVISFSFSISNSLYQKIVYVYCHLKITIVRFNLFRETYVRLSVFMSFCLCRKFATGGPTFQSPTTCLQIRLGIEENKRPWTILACSIRHRRHVKNLLPFHYAEYAWHSQRYSV